MIGLLGWLNRVHTAVIWNGRVFEVFNSDLVLFGSIIGLLVVLGVAWRIRE